MKRRTTIDFDSLISHLEETQRSISSSAVASVIMQGGEIVWEWYSGYHSYRSGAKKVDVNSQFNVASCRKTYIAFAVAYALFHGKINSIDDKVDDYIQGLNGIKSVTIRHLLTHCHGLQEQDGKIVQLFSPGTNWKYNNTGINLLIKIVERTTNKTISEILQENAFNPMGFTGTGWRTQKEENLIFNVHEDTDILGPNDSSRGDQSNLFTSAREFAFWGNLYLNKGKFNGHQLLSASLFDQITTIQSPESLPSNLPTQGYLWWVQGDNNSPMSEIGGRVPLSSFQVLGYTGCACLVIPAYNVVSVRMLNQTGQDQHPDFNYLTEIRQFGDVVKTLFTG
ncbi:serine hydrolase [Bacillaceae bacterium SIJ1]|uniref:serine hydrolase domain-containing protein n=1 Tax=Litoribacterium kuwaitense TaxID=1398745 RepID=UPI0013ECDA67|nr:serine hydrolase domain-containing protein [Litoribacterium kuwaitense]NGP45678.1 serine hydrolase [Litoribacterium kuwaitense]